MCFFPAKYTLCLPESAGQIVMLIRVVLSQGADESCSLGSLPFYSCFQFLVITQFH